MAEDAASRFPGEQWEHVDPNAAGWSRDTLQRAEAWSRQIGSTAVMVVHHGVVIAQWGDVAVRTHLASVRKSLLSALIGIAVERGQIDLTKNLAQLGIDDNEPSLSAEEKAARMADLLAAQSGVYLPTDDGGTL